LEPKLIFSQEFQRKNGKTVSITKKNQTPWISRGHKKGEKEEGGKTKFGRENLACRNVVAGETVVLADLKGSGSICRIWITMSERDVRGANYNDLII